MLVDIQYLLLLLMIVIIRATDPTVTKADRTWMQIGIAAIFLFITYAR